MKYGKTAIAFLGTALTLMTVSAFAGELDRAAPIAPQGLIVRVDGSGAREVFKATAEAPVTSDQGAAAAVTQFVTAENHVANVTSAGELDRSSSSEAWCYWPSSSYYGSYYSYNYSYYSYGYSWNYYPSYNWSWSGYSYYYYYRR